MWAGDDAVARDAGGDALCKRLAIAFSAGGRSAVSDAGEVDVIAVLRAMPMRALSVLICFHGVQITALL